MKNLSYTAPVAEKTTVSMLGMLMSTSFAINDLTENTQDSGNSWYFTK